MLHLWLRSEVKTNEHRTALTPSICRELIQNGYSISVERSGKPLTQRCYPDADYEAAGCTLVDEGSWPNAPADAIVVGLKELPEVAEGGPEVLKHTHLYFGHCYKGQGGWKDLLQRFDRGNGLLLDMEFLVDDQGRRVAAFGFMAGFAGAFVGLDTWCQQILDSNEPLPAISAFPNEESLFEYTAKRLQSAKDKAGDFPRAMIMGALGRCGRGATAFLERAGIPEDHLMRWDMEETKNGGPFEEILQADIFINCIYLSKPIPPFVTREMLDRAERKLSVVVDVSADTTNPHNPLPFANISTTFDEPTFRISTKEGKDVDVCTIDHLPTLLPKESSDRFSADLLPSLKALDKMNEHPVWKRAIDLFNKKLGEATASQ